MRFGTGGLVCLLILVTGCGEVTVDSVLRDHNIIVDGDGSDWGGVFSHIDWANTELGLCNDSNALYVCIVPRGRDVQAHIASDGCEIWFDSEKSGFERFGLRFPFGDTETAIGMIRDASRTEAVEAISHLSENVDTVEVLNEDGTIIGRSSLTESVAGGFRIAIGEYKGRLLIETCIPFSFDLGGKHLIVNEDPRIPVELVIQTPDNRDRGQDRNQEPFMPPNEVSGAVEFEEYERHTDDEYLEAVVFREQLRIQMKIKLASL